MTISIIIQSIIFGAIVATIVCVVVGFKHKPVKVSRYASEYLDKNTVNITRHSDDFVNRTVDKTPISRN